MTCLDLARPANSDLLSYNDGTSNLRPPGTVATYTCVTGYRIVGTTSVTMATRNCLTNGGWSGSNPTCQRELSYANPCNFSLSVSVIQLSTVVPWATPPTELSVHPLEPPLIKWPLTLVSLGT